jgi:hypothetical protein
MMEGGVIVTTTGVMGAGAGAGGMLPAGAGAGETDTETLGAGAGKEDSPVLPEPVSPPPQPAAATATNKPWIQGAFKRIFRTFIDGDLQRSPTGHPTEPGPGFHSIPGASNVNLVKNRNTQDSADRRKTSPTQGAARSKAFGPIDLHLIDDTQCHLHRPLTPTLSPEAGGEGEDGGMP